MNDTEWQLVVRDNKRSAQLIDPETGASITIRSGDVEKIRDLLDEAEKSLNHET